MGWNHYCHINRWLGRKQKTTCVKYGFRQESRISSPKLSWHRKCYLWHSVLKIRQKSLIFTTLKLSTSEARRPLSTLDEIIPCYYFIKRYYLSRYLGPKKKVKVTLKEIMNNRVQKRRQKWRWSKSSILRSKKPNWKWDHFRVIFKHCVCVVKSDAGAEESQDLLTKQIHLPFLPKTQSRKM